MSHHTKLEKAPLQTLLSFNIKGKDQPMLGMLGYRTIEEHTSRLAVIRPAGIFFLNPSYIISWSNIIPKIGNKQWIELTSKLKHFLEVTKSPLEDNSCYEPGMGDYSPSTPPMLDPGTTQDEHDSNEDDDGPFAYWSMEELYDRLKSFDDSIQELQRLRDEIIHEVFITRAEHNNL
jgi:hypothetical protein